MKKLLGLLTVLFVVWLIIYSVNLPPVFAQGGRSLQAQTIDRQAQSGIVQGGTPTFSNDIGGLTASFEQLYTSQTPNIRIDGCMRGGTCTAAALATNTTATSTAVVSTVTTTIVYDYFKVTATTLSGSMTVNYTVTIAH